MGLPVNRCRRQLRRCLPVCQVDCERAQWSLHGPPLVLYPDGRYKIWAERGTYRIDGNQLKLSESKKHGRGRLLRGRLIVFKFSYRVSLNSLGVRGVPGRENLDDDGFVFSLASYF